MSDYTDIEVRTKNPEALDETILALPNCAAAVIDGSWNGDTCTIRVLAGDPMLVRWAVEKQGYAELVEPEVGS